MCPVQRGRMHADFVSLVPRWQRIWHFVTHTAEIITLVNMESVMCATSRVVVGSTQNRTNPVSRIARNKVPTPGNIRLRSSYITGLGLAQRPERRTAASRYVYMHKT